MLIKQANITNNKPSELDFQRICIHNLNQKFDLVEYKWIQHHVRVRDQKGEREDERDISKMERACHFILISVGHIL